MRENIKIESAARLLENELKWVGKINSKNSLLKSKTFIFVKRMVDLSLILLAAPIVFPLGLLIVILIKLESPNAPVIFNQYRTGENGERFAMYKFRTMVANAEELKKELAHLNELEWPDFKITNDPRVTKVGRILRKTSLDELPQLLNVLKNDMSLVGPRPTSFKPETYALWHTERLDVKPGITGLWQIIGRGETEFDERLRLDILYIEYRCAWLDIQILFRTIFSIFQQKGTH